MCWLFQELASVCWLFQELAFVYGLVLDLAFMCRLFQNFAFVCPPLQELACVCWLGRVEALPGTHYNQHRYVSMLETVVEGRSCLPGYVVVGATELRSIALYLTAAQPAAI